MALECEQPITMQGISKPIYNLKYNTIKEPKYLQKKTRKEGPVTLLIGGKTLYFELWLAFI